MYIYVYNTGKIRPLDTVEEYYIYRETIKKGTQINDWNTVSNNRIFDMLVRHDTQQMA